MAHERHVGTGLGRDVDQDCVSIGGLLVTPGQRAPEAYVTPANEQDRAQVGKIANQIQKLTEKWVEAASGDQGYTGQKPAEAAQAEGMRLAV